MGLPNVLVVVMDTARWSTIHDLLADEELPNLQSIIEEGTTFSNCTSTGPWTLPSHAGLFTGQRTSNHLSHAGTKQFSATTEPLPRILKSQGYQTVAYSNNTWVSPEFGFDIGFDEFLLRWEMWEGTGDLSTIEKLDTNKERLLELASQVGEHGPVVLANLLYALYLNFRRQEDSGASRTINRLEKWFKNQRVQDRPFFAFVNFVEPHLPYEPPTDYGEHFLPESTTYEQALNVNQDPWPYVTGAKQMSEQDFEVLHSLYQGEIAYLDEKFGELFDILRHEGCYEDTVIAIVGDHGENIGDHGLMDHQYCLYESLIHVPCFIRHPDFFPANKTLEGLIELRDLFATIVDVSGKDLADFDETVSKNSLIHPIENEYRRDYVVSEYLEPQPSQSALQKHIEQSTGDLKQFDEALRCMKTEKWKYIQGSEGTKELYDLKQDPCERRNIIDLSPELANDLEEMLQEECGLLVRNPRRDEETTTDISSETKNRLEELGYIQ